MAKDVMTDEQIALEIERLKQSPHVKLAQKEVRVKYKQRRWLYQLRYLENRGKQLEAAGITFEALDHEEISYEVEGMTE